MLRVVIRIGEDIKEMLQVMCKDDGRSMTREIEQLIKERFKRIKK